MRYPLTSRSRISKHFYAWLQRLKLFLLLLLSLLLLSLTFIVSVLRIRIQLPEVLVTVVIVLAILMRGYLFHQASSGYIHLARHLM